MASKQFNRKMKIALITLAVSFSLVLAAWLYQALEVGTTTLTKRADNSFILANVRLISMDNNAVQPNQAIVVRKGVIERILPQGSEFPAGLAVIDGQQHYVMPGLIDMHVHVLDRSYAKSALAYGVTTVRNMGGFPYHLKWQTELQQGLWYGARIITSSPIMNSLAQGDPLSHFSVDDPAIARQAVRDFIGRGYNFIKVYEGLHADTYSAILDEATTLGVAVAGHPSYDLLQQAPEKHSALQTFEHTEEIYDGFLQQQQNADKALSAAEFLKTHNIALVPTLAVNRELTRLSTEKQQYLQQTDQAAINPFVRTIYENTSYKRWLNASAGLGEYNLATDQYFHQLTKLMAAHGVKIAVGSDAGALTGLPGPATLEEIQLQAEAGLDNYNVLRAATVTAGELLGPTLKTGKLATGYQADFILLADNPLTTLETLNTPKAVVQNGYYFNRADLNTLQHEAHQHSGWLLSISRHLSYLLFG